MKRWRSQKPRRRKMTPAERAAGSLLALFLLRALGLPVSASQPSVAKPAGPKRPRDLGEAETVE